MRDEGSVVSGQGGVARGVEGVILNILNIRTVVSTVQYSTVQYCRYYIILNLLYSILSIVSRFQSLGKLHFCSEL